jgi:hypothetical protein
LSSVRKGKEEGIVVATIGALDADWANRRYDPAGLWAYQPVIKPALANELSSHPIDHFIEQKFPSDVKPASIADRMTLIRRVTYDLTGLPPTIDEIESFVRDPSETKVAFQNVVDRLLESPRYGEHWARHWLDVVRYADSSGFANDYERGNAWRYRDYVVRAFNNDKPYQQFIREQIAGDELAEEATTDNQSELLVATGFLRMGIDRHGSRKDCSATFLGRCDQ